jgi:hypothetical protein
MTVTATPESIRPAGWSIVREERTRLRVEDGLTDDRVDTLTGGQLHTAAQCYLLSTDDRPGGKPWPSIGLAWRPGDRTVHLARAAALYLAEAERLDRAGHPGADRLHRAAAAVAEGLSKLIDRRPIPAPREDHST